MAVRAPADLGPRGRQLWKSLVARDETLAEPTNPMRDIAVEACHVADRCDRLDQVCRDTPVMIDGRNAIPMVHPAFAESRQQALILKQLVISLRLPDTATGIRPQTRPGAANRRQDGVGHRPVSSLDRARAAG